MTFSKLLLPIALDSTYSNRFSNQPDWNELLLNKENLSLSKWSGCHQIKGSFRLFKTTYKQYFINYMQGHFLRFTLFTFLKCIEMDKLYYWTVSWENTDMVPLYPCILLFSLKYSWPLKCSHSFYSSWYILHKIA